mgnify:CR=1 FL=1
MSENMDIDILVHTVSGEMWFVDGYWNDGGTQYQPIRPVPADNPTRKALEVGRKVLDAVKDGEELLPPIIRCESSDGGLTMGPEYAICFPVIPAEPPEPVGLTGCPVCGGAMAFIRGRHPSEDNRQVCPTCLREKMDSIRDMSDPDYGIACKEKTDGE